MKLYLLTTGEYSDYRVVAVFDEEHLEEVRRLAALIGGDVQDDEPLVLNEYQHDQPPPDARMFVRFCMFRSGMASEIHTDSLLNENGKRHKARYDVDCAERIPSLPNSVWRLHVQMYARSNEHAIKVANELRSQILAGAKPLQGDL